MLRSRSVLNLLLPKEMSAIISYKILWVWKNYGNVLRRLQPQKGPSTTVNNSIKYRTYRTFSAKDLVPYLFSIISEICLNTSIQSNDFGTIYLSWCKLMNCRNYFLSVCFNTFNGVLISEQKWFFQFLEWVIFSAKNLLQILFQFFCIFVRIFWKACGNHNMTQKTFISGIMKRMTLIQ